MIGILILPGSIKLTVRQMADLMPVNIYTTDGMETDDRYSLIGIQPVVRLQIFQPNDLRRF